MMFISSERNTFTAEFAEDLGTELHLHARADSLDLTVACPVETPRPDGAFGLSVAPGDIHLFDGTTGLRVEQLPHHIPQGEPA